MPERAVWPTLIVVDTPRFDLGLCVLDRRELMDVEALVAEAPVERLDVGVFHRFSRPNEIELYAAGVGPIFQRMAASSARHAAPRERLRALDTALSGAGGTRLSRARLDGRHHDLRPHLLPAAQGQRQLGLCRAKGRREAGR